VHVNILINTCFYLPEPKVIIVKEDSDVVLPCSLSTKENITSKQFDWKKVAQKDDCQKEVFYYNGGSNNNKNCFPGQVSHFPDELKHGNASIIIRNTKVSDSGVYTCDFPKLQPPQTFHIELVVVGAALKPSVTILTATANSALLQCEVHGNPKPKVELQDSDGNNLHAEVTQDSEREGSFYITLQTTVTKTDTYRCVATQEELKHQIYAETYVYIRGEIIPCDILIFKFFSALFICKLL
uniref:Ig-like domain-containing protein n=1 Tax=Sander lucioperca TaxID=283035 RepID=A0A8D0ACE1_SANLU